MHACRRGVLRRPNKLCEWVRAACSCSGRRLRVPRRAAPRGAAPRAALGAGILQLLRAAAPARRAAPSQAAPRRAARGAAPLSKS